MKLKEYLKLHPITKKEILLLKEFENKNFPLSLESERVLYYLHANRRVSNDEKTITYYNITVTYKT